MRANNLPKPSKGACRGCGAYLHTARTGRCIDCRRTMTRDEAAERYGDMAAMMMFRAPAGPWKLTPVGGRGTDVVSTVVVGDELVAVRVVKAEG